MTCRDTLPLDCQPSNTDALTSDCICAPTPNSFSVCLENKYCYTDKTCHDHPPLTLCARDNYNALTSDCKCDPAATSHDCVAGKYCYTDDCCRFPPQVCSTYNNELTSNCKCDPSAMYNDCFTGDRCVQVPSVAPTFKKESNGLCIDNFMPHKGPGTTKFSRNYLSWIANRRSPHYMSGAGYPTKEACYAQCSVWMAGGGAPLGIGGAPLGIMMTPSKARYDEKRLSLTYPPSASAFTEADADLCICSLWTSATQTAYWRNNGYDWAYRNQPCPVSMTNEPIYRYTKTGEITTYKNQCYHA